jgi:hypothetical protein
MTRLGTAKIKQEKTPKLKIRFMDLLYSQFQQIDNLPNYPDLIKLMETKL